MNLATNKDLQRLNQQIQTEQDPAELNRLVDEFADEIDAAMREEKKDRKDPAAL